MEKILRPRDLRTASALEGMLDYRTEQALREQLPLMPVDGDVFPQLWLSTSMVTPELQ